MKKKMLKQTKQKKIHSVIKEQILIKELEGRGENK